MESPGDPVRWGPCVLHTPLLKVWLPLVLTPLLLWGLATWRRFGRRGRNVYVALVVGTVAVFGGLCLARAASNVVSPPTWDMLAFWMFGNVAAAGRDFHVPAAFHQVAQPLIAAHPALADDPQFVANVLDVGFPYPPPAVWLVAPLGLLDLRMATLLWQGLHLAALAAAVVLIWRTFLAEDRLLGLAVAGALVLTLRPTYSTVALAQTNFLVLILLLAFWHTHARPIGGAFLALGIVTKPLLGFMLVYLVVRRFWASLGVAALTLAALCLLTAAVFGIDPFLSYLHANPVARLPTWVYRIQENQSLLAGIVRLTGYDVAQGSPLRHPLYLALALLFGGSTVWLAWRHGATRPRIVMALVLVTALLLYPQSWQHYTVFLIVPVLLFWQDRAALGLSTASVIGFITVAYALVRYREGDFALYASLLTWCVLAGVLMSARRRAIISPGAMQSNRAGDAVPERRRRAVAASAGVSG
jgi:hypothetical protein